MQLQQLQAAIDEADGNRALVSNVVRDAAAAGHLAFKDMKRLVKGCDALTQPATCLGELALINVYTAKLEHCRTSARKIPLHSRTFVDGTAAAECALQNTRQACRLAGLSDIVQRRPAFRLPLMLHIGAGCWMGG